MREIKFRYTFQHDETGRIGSVIKNLDDEGPYLDFPSNRWTLLGIGQYTGLKDQTGKNIYEGDIVYSKFRSPGEHTYTVKWIEISAEFSIQNKDICEQFVEIIGNIYEKQAVLND